jgi:hypothetical protein
MSKKSIKARMEVPVPTFKPKLISRQRSCSVIDNRRPKKEEIKLPKEAGYPLKSLDIDINLLR